MPSLVYFEVFTNIKVAIAREKEIKGWRREKKDRLVETKNPEWRDLAADWFVDELQLYGKPVRLKEKPTQGPSGLLARLRNCARA